MRLTLGAYLCYSWNFQWDNRGTAQIVGWSLLQNASESSALYTATIVIASGALTDSARQMACVLLVVMCLWFIQDV